MIEEPVLTLLVGVPCSGKSTYRGKHLSDERFFVLSADDIQTAILAKMGWEYGDRFALPMEGELSHVKYGENVDGFWSKVNEVNELIDAAFADSVENAREALLSGKNVLVDLTCHTKEYRKTVLEWFEGIVFRSCTIVFDFEPIREVIFERNKKRSAEGKVVPQEVIERMMAEFEDVSLDEGFSAITKVSGT